MNTDVIYNARTPATVGPPRIYLPLASVSRNELTTPVPDDVPQNISNDSSSTAEGNYRPTGRRFASGRGDAAVFPEAEKIDSPPCLKR